METLRLELLYGSATAITCIGPDASYGLAQCYGALSSDDCQLCFSAARTNLTRCSLSNAGQVYLDGCFTRSGNYGFYLEYTGPHDKAVTNEKYGISGFSKAGCSTGCFNCSENKGCAKAEVAVPGTVNESAYVLANCWGTLSMSDCRACLDNASSSISLIRMLSLIVPSYI